jgi:hypothetical protein
MLRTMTTAGGGERVPFSRSRGADEELGEARKTLVGYWGLVAEGAGSNVFFRNWKAW